MCLQTFTLWKILLAALTFDIFYGFNFESVEVCIKEYLFYFIILSEFVSS